MRQHARLNELRHGARYYDPTHGRYTQPDPSGQEANNYLYAAGDPVNNLDPTGRSLVSNVLKGFGYAAAAAAVVSTGGAALAFGAAAVGLDIASSATSGASGEQIAGTALVDAFTFGVGGATVGLGVRGGLAYGINGTYAALGLGAGYLIG